MRVQDYVGMAGSVEVEREIVCICQEKSYWEGAYVGMAGSCFFVRRLMPPPNECLKKQW
jgi:hypothetical protein